MRSIWARESQLHAMKRRSTILMKLAIAAVWCVHTAHAQQLGIVPDPMTSDELSAMLDAIKAAPEQRQFIEAAHEAYIDQSLLFRDSDVEAVHDQLWRNEQAVEALGRTPLHPPGLREHTQAIERLHERIAELDDDFFAKAATALEGEQQPMWQCIQLRRARERIESNMHWYDQHVPAARVDLTQLCGSLPLKDDVQDQLRPILREYEPKLTALQEHAWRVVQVMTLDVSALVRADGFEEIPPFDDVAAFERWAQSQHRALDVAGTRMIAAGMKISDLNRKTLDELLQALPEGERSWLRDAYEKAAYPKMPLASGARDLASALRIPEISKDDRAKLRQLWEELAVEERAIRNKTADAYDAWIKRRTDFLYTQSDTGLGSLDDALDDLRRRRDELNQRAHVVLSEIVGEEWRDRLKSVADERRTATRSKPAEPRWPVRTTTDRAPPSTLRQIAGGVAGDPLLQLAVLNEFLASAGIDTARAERARSLHALYAERHALLRNTLMQLGEQQSAMWKADPVTERFFVTVEHMLTYHADVEAAGRAMDALNDEFISELHAALAGVDGSCATLMSRSLACWKRSTYVPEAKQSQSVVRGQVMLESDMDLAALCLLLELYSNAHPEVETLLAGYEKPLLDLRRAAKEQAAVLPRIGDVRSAHRLELRNIGERVPPETHRQFEREYEEAGEALATTRRKLKQLNRGTLAALMDVLDETAARDLEAEYLRTAYPTLHNAWPGFKESYEAVLKLDSLTTEQLVELQAVYGRFRGHEQRLKQQAIETLRKADDTMHAYGVASRDFRFAHRVNRLLFEAKEQLARMARRLRDVLTPEQWAALVGRSESNDLTAGS